MERVFSLSNLLVLPFWLLMIVFPHWRWTKRIIQSPLVVAPFATVYAALALPRSRELLPTVSNPTLDGVRTLLSKPENATIGWIHFLAFDLFVGRWAFLDSRERGISAWIMAPVLLLVLMLGPAGFLLYLLVRVFAAPRKDNHANTQSPRLV